MNLQYFENHKVDDKMPIVFFRWRCFYTLTLHVGIYPETEGLGQDLI